MFIEVRAKELTKQQTNFKFIFINTNFIYKTEKMLNDNILIYLTLHSNNEIYEVDSRYVNINSIIKGIK